MRVQLILLLQQLRRAHVTDVGRNCDGRQPCQHWQSLLGRQRRHALERQIQNSFKGFDFVTPKIRRLLVPARERGVSAPRIRKKARTMAIAARRLL